jgi:hypothetical protein
MMPPEMTSGGIHLRTALGHNRANAPVAPSVARESRADFAIVEDEATA